MKNAIARKLNSLVFFLVAMYSIVLGQPGKEVYTNYCAGCHGPKREGSSATALIKTTWTHGNSRNAIMKSIRDGIPGTEMARWDGVLSKKDILAVTEYILSAQRKKVQKNPKPSTAVTVIEKPLLLDTKHYKLKVEKLIAQGLNGPWGLEFIDNKIDILDLEEPVDSLIQKKFETGFVEEKINSIRERNNRNT